MSKREHKVELEREDFLSIWDNYNLYLDWLVQIEVANIGYMDMVGGGFFSDKKSFKAPNGTLIKLISAMDHYPETYVRQRLFDTPLVLPVVKSPESTALIEPFLSDLLRIRNIKTTAYSRSSRSNSSFYVEDVHFYFNFSSGHKTFPVFTCGEVDNWIKQYGGNSSSVGKDLLTAIVDTMKEEKLPFLASFELHKCMDILTL